ncbi:hypothetical protein QYE76_067551 [Lolium multiflorum]|uniref:Bifunctional inhibitor/plant lipid transfer protein/seed storage helical domain-containing protein n=1 Tax=Lolium multiflorum TaxID=4521 RepID=A0AAD8WD32_LOLMU|nr:hypothetical protein QYE76_067549 [Lolium multiflorum]KAK1649746.1 hypothetical protein QYE76_067551 [Lolium multiflorum]
MPPQPKECLPSIMGLMPCKDFLTNQSAPPPPYPGKCCDGLKSLLKDTPICLCHLDDGGFDQVLSAHMNIENFAALMVDICKSGGPADFGSCSGPVPPVRAPAPGAAS